MFLLQIFIIPESSGGITSQDPEIIEVITSDPMSSDRTPAAVILSPSNLSNSSSGWQVHWVILFCVVLC